MAHHVRHGPDVLIDDRDPDAGADDDGLVVDRVGRAERGDDTRAERLQRGLVVSGRGDDRKLVASQPRHQVVGAQRLGEALRHAADQLVADRVPERVVDILEVIEIDIEYRGRRGALLHALDDRLQPFAEENAVRQPAKRIVEGEMPQPGLAGRDGGRGLAHMPQHQARQQHEAAERDADEGGDAVEDLGARLPRHPCEAGDRFALLVGQIEDIVAGSGRPVGDIVQIVQPQPRADLPQHLVIDELHAQDDRGVGVGIGGRIAAVGDRDGADDRGTAEKRLQAGRAMVAQAGHVDGEAVAGVAAAAHHVEDRSKLRLDRVEPVRIDAAAAERGIEEMIGRIGDEDEIMIEERLQPQARPRSGPSRGRS